MSEIRNAVEPAGALAIIESNWKKWAEMGVLGVEMESYALYCIALEQEVTLLQSAHAQIQW